MTAHAAIVAMLAIVRRSSHVIALVASAGVAACGSTIPPHSAQASVANAISSAPPSEAPSRQSPFVGSHTMPSSSALSPTAAERDTPADRAARALHDASDAVEHSLSSTASDLVCGSGDRSALVAAVREYLRVAINDGVRADEHDANVITDALLQPIARAGGAAGVRVVGAERPFERPEWLAVRVEFRLESSLYVYQRGASGWSLIMADESPGRCDERSIELVTLVGASSSDGPYFVVLDDPGFGVGLPPLVHMRVIAPGANALAPRVLYHEVLGNLAATDDSQPIASVVTDPGGFQLAFGVMGRARRGPGRWTYTNCDAAARYSIRDGRVRRTGRVRLSNCENVRDET